MTPLILVCLLIGLIGGAVWLLQQRTQRSRTLRPSSRAQQRHRAAPWYATRGRCGAIVLALIGLLLVGLILSNLGLLNAGTRVPPGEFSVRIAPFRSQGEDTRQGTIVAEQLLAELKQRITTPMNVGLIGTEVTSAQQALDLAQANNVDVIVWGDVAAGTTADQPGLRPQLLWRPAEPFVPRTWQGYDGHFAVPADYDLALQSFNGPVVLAPLLDGLNHFSRGDADLATEKLSALQRDYGDVLRPELPAMLQAIILWAEGLLPDAEAAARIALEANRRAEHWNNLGAILLDQQQLDPAREELIQAVAAAPNLAQAHANLGRLLLDSGQPAAALPDLRSAASLAPQSPPIVATLGEAYRRSGQLGAARTAVTAVLTLDPDNGPALAEQSMLALTPSITATERLEWELEQPPTRTAEELAQLRSTTETGIAGIEALRNENLRRAAAYGASVRPSMQRLAEKQAALLEQELLNRRYQLMLIQIDQGRVFQAQPRSGVRRFWDTVTGRRTPLQEAIATANAALRQEPSLALQYDYHYQRGRAAYLGDDQGLAQTAWDAALQLSDTAPETSTVRGRPEAYYGRAQQRLDDNDRDAARIELDAALAADAQFFPARLLLARMAEEDRQWAEAEAQYRWLAEHRPWQAEHRLDLAHALREQGKIAEAEAQLLPPANANDVDALVMLAALYRTAGKLDEAQAISQRALNSAPSSPAVHEELAELALARNDPQTAEVEYRRALELDPQRSEAHIMLGRLYAGQLNQPAAAADQFRAAVENESTDPLVHRQLGEVLLQIGNPAAAEASFKRALELDPNAHEAHHGLATAYLAQNQYAAAEQEENRALEIANGNYTLATVGLGDIARAQRRYDEAVQRYTSALERDPNLAVAYLGLGSAALAQGQPAIALTHFRAGLEREPQNVPLLMGLGDTLLQQNDPDNARDAYERARQIQPSNAAAHAGIGQALWRAGETDAALSALAQATQINPNDADTLLTVGNINDTLGRTDAALQAYGQAANARSDWYEPRFRRGVLLLEQQQTEAAIEDLEAAVRLNDEFAQGRYWLGRAYRANGRFADAARQFRLAIDQQSNYFEARFFLGRTLDELGQAPEAIDTYTAIIAEAPATDQWAIEAARELDRIR